MLSPHYSPVHAPAQERKIEISSEMMAVMDALTSRERSIIEALIKRGGRMTQAEIRYETNLPRSTLAMVLISLEKRGLITKREWGRTNVVELTEQFFSGKQ
ncbi:MAG: helix-turn-helix domain-containing protein [Methanothrix sp.]